MCRMESTFTLLGGRERGRILRALLCTRGLKAHGSVTDSFNRVCGRLPPHEDQRNRPGIRQQRSGRPGNKVDNRGSSAFVRPLRRWVRCIRFGTRRLHIPLHGPDC
jgi:hypothetical protein